VGVEVKHHSFLISALDGIGHLHALAASVPSKEPRYPLNRRMVGLHSRSGHFEEEETLNNSSSVCYGNSKK
jgi:hypothetical protein